MDAPRWQRAVEDGAVDTSPWVNERRSMSHGADHTPAVRRPRHGGRTPWLHPFTSSASQAVLVVSRTTTRCPGVLKNAVDWASRPSGDSAWSGKAAAVMGASVGSTGTVQAQYRLRQVFMFLDMHAMNQPEVMIGNASTGFDDEGKITDETSRELIRNLLANLVDWTRRVAGAGAAH